MTSTFEFTVPLHETPDQDATWLTRTLGTTTSEAEAVRFRFRAHSTFADDCRIEMAMDAIAGGVDRVVDLSSAVDATNLRIMDEARALWRSTAAPSADNSTGEASALFPSDYEPEPEPEAEAEPEPEPEPTAAEIAAIIDAASLAPSDPRYRSLARLIAGYDRMDNLLASMRLAAAWPVLIVSPPEGWEDFGAMPLADHIKRATVKAYAAARRAVEASGKA